MITRIALIAVSLFLSGCGALRQVPHIASHQLSHNLGENAARINEAYTQATNTVILTNILRARDSWPTAYTTVSGITATPNIVFTADGEFSPLGLGNAPLPFSGSKAGVSQANTAKLAYEINPFAEEKGAQNVYVPISAQMFRDYWNRNFSNEILLALFVESYEIDGRIFVNTVEGYEKFANEFLMRVILKRDEPVAKVEKCECEGEPTRTDLSPIKLEYFAINSKLDPGCDEITHFDSEQLFLKTSTDKKATYIAQVEALKKNFGANLKFEFDNGKTTIKYCKNEINHSFVNSHPEIKIEGFRSEEQKFYVLSDESQPNVSNLSEPEAVKIQLRSIDEAIAYVGKWVSKNGQGNGSSDLFLVTPRTVPAYLAKGREDDYGAVARHADKVYYAAKAGSEDDSTGEVLSLLAALYVRSQSKEFLEAPEVSNLKLEN